MFKFLDLTHSYNPSEEYELPLFQKSADKILRIITQIHLIVIFTLIILIVTMYMNRFYSEEIRQAFVDFLIETILPTCIFYAELLFVRLITYLDYKKSIK